MVLHHGVGALAGEGLQVVVHLGTQLGEFLRIRPGLGGLQLSGRPADQLGLARGRLGDHLE
jgi:hypothetical protein